MLMNNWIVETLNASVDEELNKLNVKLRAKFIHIAEMIEELGLENVREPYIKPLNINANKKVWEIRVKHSNNIARAAYVTVKHKRIIILSVFIKKSTQIPKLEMAKIFRRLKELETRGDKK